MKNATLTAVLCGTALAVCALGSPSARTPTDSDEAIVHVLNRVAFGPTPADMEHVRATGIARYLDEQLHPDRLSDSGMDARLAGLETLHLSSRDIAERFEIP